jgi:glycosidase
MVLSYSGASHDNNVEWDPVYHNTRDGFYRNPGWGTTSGNTKTGAVPVGQDVILRIRTAVNDLTSARIRYWNGELSAGGFIDMTKTSSTTEYDFWEGTLSSPTQPTDLYYSFFLTDGTDTDYYNDNSILDGGVGRVTSDHDSQSDYGIVFYDPSFKTPDWHKNRVGYQIFLDRFYNGDPANDAQGDGESGDITWFEWDSNGDGSFTSSDEQRVFAQKKDWNQLPSEGHDYYGGDFKGIKDKIPYLNELGIGFIWFNPFSESPDNHGYAVDNYKSVDPYYGVISTRDGGLVKNDLSASLAVFDDVEQSLEASGIKIIYDTVLNHVSAQSQYFQRYENMENGDLILPTDFNVSDMHPSIQGAYESVNSPYRDWFKFFLGNHDYDAWWGFRNIPTLKYDQTTEIETELISGINSIFSFWNDHGVDGFRLDVNPDYDDGQGSRHVNKLIRERVKSDNSNNLIVGEVWGRANTWLTGTMNDAVQNMVFRDETIKWLTLESRNYDDTSYTNKLLSMQENYPPEAFYSLWTLLGNHDTARIITEVGSADKVLLAATIQFSFPGVPIIYYGDEVGLQGNSDPDCRRPYPWGSENQTLFDYYKKLISLRQTYDVLREGSFCIMEDNAEGVLVFGRESPESNHRDAIIIVNENKYSLALKINISDLTELSGGDVLVDLINNNNSYTIDPDLTLNVIINPYGKMVLISDMLPSTIPSDTTTSTASSAGIFHLVIILAAITLIIKKRKKYE